MYFRYVETTVKSMCRPPMYRSREGGSMGSEDGDSWRAYTITHLFLGRDKSLYDCQGNAYGSYNGVSRTNLHPLSKV